MARSIDYWYNFIIGKKNSTEELNALNSTSKTANYNLCIYIVAVAIAALDNLFDFHKIDVDAQLATKKPHSVTWYRDLALRFQYGQALVADSDQYANEGLTDVQIAEQKIIAQAAVNEIPPGVYLDDLRIKVVKLVDGDYAQLNGPEKNAFKTYIDSTKDAGVHIAVDSLPPDSLKLNIDVWYNPLVLKSDGSRIDASISTPVANAINDYLKNLKFNGEYANTRLSNSIRAVTGVELVSIKLSQAKYGGFGFTNIDEIYIPDAGYLRIAAGDLTINYRAYDIQG